MSFQRAAAILDEAIERQVTPCAAVEVGGLGGPMWREARGRLTYDAAAPAATPDTLFDLASLTKVLATTTLAMRLVESRRVPLEAPLGTLLPEWQGEERSAVTVSDLLEHCAGLPAVRPFYETCNGRDDFQRAIAHEPLEYAPRTRSIYSDLGFILLGFVLEDAGGAALNVQWREFARTLGAAADEPLEFGPFEAARGTSGNERFAPTQADEWRGGRLLRGDVDDRNCAALGGVAGHAGLFGTVGAVGRVAAGLLRGYLGDEANGLAAPATIGRFLVRSSVPGSSRALGWDLMLPTSSCGTRMSEQAFGHTGFTGTSLWIDPAARLYVVLLTNRVYPRAGSVEPIRDLRRAFHDAVMGRL